MNTQGQYNNNWNLSNNGSVYNQKQWYIDLNKMSTPPEVDNNINEGRQLLTF